MNGNNRLCIISGYATSAMAFNHIQKLLERNAQINIEVIVGMSVQDGISLSNHRGFQELMNQYNERFYCSYNYNENPIHSKVYVWLNNDNPTLCFVGSANYTQFAFMGRQREAMTQSDPNLGLSYYQSKIQNSIYCTHIEANQLVVIYNDQQRTRVRVTLNNNDEQQAEHEGSVNTIGLDHVTVSFLDNNNELPQRSGLNWGQRPEESREPNQAYIRLPSAVYNSDFFPERRVHFTLLTDDNRVLICSRAQENGKAIHTPHNNSLIGEYFRNRLGLPNGALVRKGDLDRYGRTDLTFYKIDNETYYLDFSA